MTSLSIFKMDFLKPPVNILDLIINNFFTIKQKRANFNRGFFILYILFNVYIQLHGLLSLCAVPHYCLKPNKLCLLYFLGLCDS